MKPKSNRRTMSRSLRRAWHIEFASQLRDRKRRRKERAEIHAAMAEAKRRKENALTEGKSVTVGETTWNNVDLNPVRATDKKTGKGWRTEDALTGLIVEFSASRDKARARAKELNDERSAGRQEYGQNACKSFDGHMLDLGFKRIEPGGKTVETKYVKFSIPGRILVASTDVPVPTSIDDVIDPKTGAAREGWIG